MSHPFILSYLLLCFHKVSGKFLFFFYIIASIFLLYKWILNLHNLIFLASRKPAMSWDSGKQNPQVHISRFNFLYWLLRKLLFSRYNICSSISYSNLIAIMHVFLQCKHILSHHHFPWLLLDFLCSMFNIISTIIINKFFYYFFAS